jgi:cytochrome c oxidase subunit 2
MRRTTLARAICLAVIAGTLLGLAGCGSRPDSIDPVTDSGRSISDLFLISMVLSGLVFLLVASLLVYLIIRFRGRAGDGSASEREGNRPLEIAWTAAPALLLVVLFVLAVRTMLAVEDDPGPAALHIRVIGHQWWWEYQYPDLGFVTANELHVPVGTPVRLDLDGGDVIHSFWVPRIGWKMDAIPGKTNTMTFEVDDAGTYDGGCTEFCGVQHAWMRIRVVAEPPDQFDAWVQRQQQSAQPAQDEIARGGEDLFLQSTCVNCHTVRGTQAGGTVGPDLTHLGSRTTLGSGVLDNTPEELARWIQDAHSVKPGVLMPTYNFTEDELQALVRYLEGLE